MTIDKTVDNDHVLVKAPVVFTIDVTNEGPCNATNVVITDVVPEQFKVTGYSEGYDIETNTITVPLLVVGEHFVFTINATTLVNGTWNNTANVTCEENRTVKNDTVVVKVDPVVNLTIDKSVDHPVVYVNDTVVFTIVVTNNGPSNATGVVIKDVVPVQFKVTGSNDTAYINNQLIVSKLNVGESYAFTITAVALVNGTWTNIANVTCSENKTVKEDNETVVVKPVVNLTIDKTVDNDHVFVEAPVVFTINVTNEAHVMLIM